MVKRREPYTGLNTLHSNPSPEAVEAFASQADGGHLSASYATPVMVASPQVKENRLGRALPLSSTSQKSPSEELDPQANRDYKAIRVPFNAYEFAKLEELAQKTGRTKLNAIRWAIMSLNEQM